MPRVRSGPTDAYFEVSDQAYPGSPLRSRALKTGLREFLASEQLAPEINSASVSTPAKRLSTCRLGCVARSRAALINTGSRPGSRTLGPLAGLCAPRMLGGIARGYRLKVRRRVGRRAQLQRGTGW